MSKRARTTAAVELGSDAWQHAFAFLHVLDLVRVRCVSRTWRSMGTVTAATRYTHLALDRRLGRLLHTSVGDGTWQGFLRLVQTMMGVTHVSEDEFFHDFSFFQKRTEHEVRRHWEALATRRKLRRLVLDDLTFSLHADAFQRCTAIQELRLLLRNHYSLQLCHLEQAFVDGLTSLQLGFTAPRHWAPLVWKARRMCTLQVNVSWYRDYSWDAWLAPARIECPRLRHLDLRVRHDAQERDVLNGLLPRLLSQLETLKLQSDDRDWFLVEASSRSCTLEFDELAAPSFGSSSTSDFVFRWLDALRPFIAQHDVVRWTMRTWRYRSEGPNQPRFDWAEYWRRVEACCGKNGFREWTPAFSVFPDCAPPLSLSGQVQRLRLPGEYNDPSLAWIVERFAPRCPELVLGKAPRIDQLASLGSTHVQRVVWSGGVTTTRAERGWWVPLDLENAVISSCGASRE